MSSSLCFPNIAASGNEGGEAMDLYKSIIDSNREPTERTIEFNCPMCQFLERFLNENRKKSVQRMVFEVQLDGKV
jgi:hypothetical protein